MGMEVKKNRLGRHHISSLLLSLSIPFLLSSKFSFRGWWFGDSELVKSPR